MQIAGMTGSDAMHARQRDNVRTELRSLIVLIGNPDEWMKAHDVASHVNLPWRKVAFALRRLSKRGYIEQQIVTYRGKHRSQEYTTQYRAIDHRSTGTTFKDRYFNWIKT